MKGSVRARGVQDQLSLNIDALIETPALEFHAHFQLGSLFQLHAVNVFHSQRLGLAYKEMIELRTVPMRVGYCVVRTRGDHEFVRTICLRCPFMARPMVQESET